jgi:hypothetical protein
MGAGNEYSLDHHYWVCGRSDREAPSSWKQVRAFWIYRDYPARDCRSFCRNIPWPGGGVVSSWRERGFHWSNRWRNHSTGSVGDNRSSPSADVGLIAFACRITCFVACQQLGQARHQRRTIEGGQGTTVRAQWRQHTGAFRLAALSNKLSDALLPAKTSN